MYIQTDIPLSPSLYTCQPLTVYNNLQCAAIAAIAVPSAMVLCSSWCRKTQPYLFAWKTSSPPDNLNHLNKLPIPAIYHISPKEGQICTLSKKITMRSLVPIVRHTEQLWSIAGHSFLSKEFNSMRL